MVTGVMLILFLCYVQTCFKWQVANCEGNVPSFDKESIWVCLTEEFGSQKEVGWCDRVFLCACVSVCGRVCLQVNRRSAEWEKERRREKEILQCSLR